MNSMNSKNRNQAKGWFLTFPKTTLTKEALLVECQAIGDVAEYVIAAEPHEDGSPHLHAFIKWSAKKRFTQMKFSKHGNYQVAKSWKAVQAYVTKGKDFIANIDTESAKQKRGKHNLALATMDPLVALEEGEIGFMQLKNFVNNQQTYQMLKRKSARADIPLDLEKRRHVWIWGPSNTGKSHRIKEFINMQGDENCFQIPYNDDWTGYCDQKYLWADEFKGQLTIQALNRLCDGGAKVNTKGGTTQIVWDPVLIIASNFDIRDCYSKAGFELHKTLENRFKLEEFTKVYD